MSDLRAEGSLAGGDHDRPRDEPAAAWDRQGVLIAVIVALALFGLSWVRHRNYWSGFDLAIFDQGAWQLSEGRDHISVVERRVLADHFSPVMLAFGVLYRLVASPLWLLGAQAAALGATVLPVRALARDVGTSVPLATGLAIVNAPILSAAVFDFHPSTLAVPFIAATVLNAVRDRTGPALACGVAVALCRADLGIAVLAVAVVAGRRSRLPLAALGIASIAIGAAVPGQFGETNGWLPHFGHLGDSPLDAALQPWVAIGSLLSAGSIATVVAWLLAAGGIVVLRPRWVLAALVAGLPILLSQWVGTEHPWFHYGAPVAPIVIGGAVLAIEPFRQLASRRSALVGLLPVLAAGLMLMVASPLAPGGPDHTRPWVFMRVDPGTDPGAALARVGSDEVVSANERLLPHLTHRERAYMFPIPFSVPEGFFAEGSAPDLATYDRDEVERVILRFQGGPEPDVPGFVVVARPAGYLVLEPEPG